MTGRAQLVLVVLLAAMVACGWFGRGWYEDSLALTAEKADRAADEKITAGVQAISAAVGATIEGKLSGLNANEIRLQPIYQKEIIKPVFSNVCATDDYVRMWNDDISAAERTLSGK